MIKYRDNYEEIKSAYSEILEVLKKYENFKEIYGYDFSDILRMMDECKKHIGAIELYENYGLETNYTNICNINNPLYYTKLNEYWYVASYDEKSNGTISWSDDGKQPNDETLVVCCFSTGAYIFGADYPTEIFNEFFEELKTYNPKYADSHNHSLYFELDTAREIYSRFEDIKKKYEELYKEYAKNKKIEEYKKAIENLEREDKE